MRRVMIALGVTGSLLLAVAPVSCANDLFNVLATLCPDCYAHYLQVTGH